MLKKILMGIGALLLLLFLVGVGLYLKANSHFNQIAAQTFEDPKLSLSVALNPEWAQEGERIAKVKGCIDCHDSDLAGKIFIQDPPIGTFAGPNLTKGAGGVVANYTDEDWVRSIRFGRSTHKKYLRFMPSSEYSFLTDEDLAKLIVYLKSLPPIDRESIAVKPGPMAKVLHYFGKMPLLFPGELIDVNQSFTVSLQASESAEYGKYLSASCVGCHYQNFGGGVIPGVPPNWPKSANLTAKSNFAKWSFEEFHKTAMTGVTPEGKTLNPQFMPWPALAAMNETELKALYNFLKSLPEASENQ